MVNFIATEKILGVIRKLETRLGKKKNMKITTKQFLLNFLRQAGQCQRDVLRMVCKRSLNRDSATTDRKLRELTQERR